MDPEMAVRTPPTAAQPIRTVEPVKAFYQPDVMTRQPVSLKSVSPTPWNTQSPISPNKRGVPPSQTAYGQQFRETRTTTTNNHFDTSPALLTPSNNLGVDVSNVRRSPLPPDIRKVTSPRLSKSPKTVCWPPKAPAEKTSNRYWHIAPETKVADKWISLQELVRQEDNRDRGGPPSPKRYLLRGETKKPEPLPPDPVRTQNVDPVILKVLPPNVFEPITVASMYDNFYPSGSHEEPDDEFEVAHYRERSGESIPARWANVSEIVEERDIMTENSSTKRSDDEASLSLKHIVEGRRSDDETTADQWDSDSETERWMREEVELARKERELAEELAKQRLQELARDASGAVEGSDGVDMDTDFDRDTELSEVLETTQDKPESPYEDFNEHDAVTSSTSSCHPSGAKYDLCEALFVPNKITIPEEAEESPLISEEDKRMAIESIERHQRTLQDQQQQLSALLDDAILFLKGLDSDFSSKYLETPLIANRLRYKEDQESKDTSLATPSVSETTLEPHYSRASKNIVRALSQSEEYTGNNNYARNEAHHHYESHQQQTNNNHNHFNESPQQPPQPVQQAADGTRGKGQLMNNVSRIPYCEHCKQQIRGAFVLATGLTWCPEHFTCANASCGRKLLDVGFVEEKGKKYCEQCFERLIAPQCSKCRKPITADCLNALQKQWHPHCFVCAHCHKPFGNSAFYLEQGQPYCEEDWNTLFTTKCVSCKFPIEAGDRWVEALGSAFHSNCFNCTTCQVNLEGESFYAKNGAPYCKAHA
ncbi:hypothetical protein L596_005271 [Steinernema carpocapsae]|nr:hypothetical protein L596_005271 [Steinernema carpocapsae]